MPPAEILEKIKDLNPYALKLEGFEDCLIGVAHLRFSFPVLAYDIQKVKTRVSEIDKVPAEDLDRHFEFKRLNEFLGKSGSPVFIDFSNGNNNKRDSGNKKNPES